LDKFKALRIYVASGDIVGLHNDRDTLRWATMQTPPLTYLTRLVHQRRGLRCVSQSLLLYSASLSDQGETRNMQTSPATHSSVADYPCMHKADTKPSGKKYKRLNNSVFIECF
jgi:hypothetical protein